MLPANGDFVSGDSSRSNERLDVVRGELAVSLVPLDVLAQLEGVGQAIRRDIPAGSEVRHDLGAVRLVPDQRVVDVPHEQRVGGGRHEMRIERALDAAGRDRQRVLARLLSGRLPGAAAARPGAAAGGGAAVGRQPASTRPASWPRLVRWWRRPADSSAGRTAPPIGTPSAARAAPSACRPDGAVGYDFLIAAPPNPSTLIEQIAFLALSTSQTAIFCFWSHLVQLETGNYDCVGLGRASSRKNPNASITGRSLNENRTASPPTLACSCQAQDGTTNVSPSCPVEALARR